jgi:hydantoinase/carbamoylase family amidase
VVASLHDAKRWLPFAVEVVAFADEESYRFPTMYLGSGYWTGQFDPALLAGTDADGITLEQGIRDFACDPVAVCLPVPQRNDILAFVELHIEQGPVLEAEDRPIGIVSRIAGASKYLVTVEGVAGHAGTVPMNLRRDALVGASECVLAIDELATSGAAGGLVATVGWQVVSPGAKNVIPGRVEFSIDLRHPSDEARFEAVDRMIATIREIGQRRHLEITIVETPGAGATPMDTGLIALWRDVFREAGLEPRELSSGAGHDAVMVSKIAPVSMLFLRCKGGVSHNPAESIRSDDAAVGVKLLTRFLDRLAGHGITCA